jgi:hypothetical protein
MILFKIPALLVSLILLAPPNNLAAQPTLVLDPALSDQQLSEIQSVTGDVLTAFERSFSFQFQPSIVMVFSSDPVFLARDLSRRTGGPYEDNLRAYQNWIHAEAGYRRIHVNMASQSWQNRQDRRPLIAHELFHVLQNELIGRRSANCCDPARIGSIGPTWLTEGSANYFERIITGRDMNGYLRFARQQVGNLGGNQLNVLETRNGMDSISESYDIGAYGVSQLIKRAGASAVFSYFQALGRGQRWERAFEGAFGLPHEEFYDGFR